MGKRTSDGYMANGPAKKYKEPAPEFTLSEKNLPAIKSWEVGKKYAIELNVEMVSHSKGSPFGLDSENKKHEARFKILSVDSQEGANASENVDEKD